MAYLCESLSAARPTQTLADLVPSFSALADSSSFRTLAWRTRILAGTVRYAGPGLLPHLPKIVPVLTATLEHEDKDVRKAGGKLLRRALQVRRDSAVRG